MWWGGSSTPETPAVNTSLASAARGYYEGFALIDVTSADLRIDAPDFKAIFDEKKFVIGYNDTIDLVYRGTFTEVSDTTFKADIRVYKDGAFLTTATITNGTITAGTSIKGTITGTGDYASSVGDIEFAYNNANSLLPPAYTFGAANAWQNTEAYIEFNTQTNIVFLTNAQPPLVNSCTSTAFDTANVTNEQTGRIRRFTTSPLTCATVPNGSTFDGYFTNFNGDTADDDSIFLVVSNDDYAYAGVLTCNDGLGNCW